MSAGFGSLPRVEALVALARRQPRAIEAVVPAVGLDGPQGGGQLPSIRAGRDSPDEGRIVRVGRDGASQRADARPVRTAVIAHQSASFDLRGEVLPGALHAAAEPARRAHRFEEIDHQRGDIDVHLRSRMLEARRARKGGEPVAWLLLVRANPCRGRPETGVQIAVGRGPWLHHQRAAHHQRELRRCQSSTRRRDERRVSPIPGGAQPVRAVPDREDRQVRHAGIGKGADGFNRDRHRDRRHEAHAADAA